MCKRSRWLISSTSLWPSKMSFLPAACTKLIICWTVFITVVFTTPFTELLIVLICISAPEISYRTSISTPRLVSPRDSRVLFNRKGPKGLWVYLDTLVYVVYGLRSLSCHPYSEFFLFRCLRWYLEILLITENGGRGNQNGCSSDSIQHKATYYSLYERYMTLLSNEFRYENVGSLIRSQEVKRSIILAVA